MRVTVKGGPQQYDISDLRACLAPPNGLVVLGADGVIQHIPNAFCTPGVISSAAAEALRVSGLLPTMFDTPTMADIYPADETAREVAFLAARLGDASAAGRVLDVGCGVGRLAVPLSHIGYEIEGVDISHRSILELRRRLADIRPAPQLFVADIAGFMSPDRYKRAFSAMNSLRYLATPERLRNHFICMNRSIALGGEYIIYISVQEVGREVATDQVSWTAAQAKYTWRVGMVDKLNGTADEVVLIDYEGEKLPHREVQQQTWIRRDEFDALLSDTGWRVESSFDAAGVSIPHSADESTRWLVLKSTRGICGE